MRDSDSFQLGRTAWRVCLGSVGVALITATCFPLHLDYAIPGFLFLLVVVLLSLSSGFIASATVSFIAVGCLDYFFIPPVLTWRITEPVNAIVLLTFFATSTVITRLASRAREEARATEDKRQEIALLYEVAARLLSLEPEMAGGARSLRVFREVFGLRAASLFDAGSARLHIEGESAHALGERTRDAYLSGKDDNDPERRIHIRCLYVAGKTTGAVGFEGEFDDNSTVGPLSMLAAAALERSQSFRNASKAAAAVQTEVLRSAILDAFAHEFKTPLAVILAAAGGLQEAGSLGPEQLEMTEIIESQASRLSRLTTRLLRMAKLDREEVKPRLEATDLRGLVADLVEQYRSQAEERTISVRSDPGPVEVLSDSELLNLALNQLLDNAIKYSRPGSVVSIELETREGHADVLVSNEGHSVKPEERERIFERFYRGTDAENLAAGTGLGLYVARKIVRAHAGTLEFELGRTTANVTTFRLRLPLFRRERHHERKAS